jgi:hypothetical protein
VKLSDHTWLGWLNLLLVQWSFFRIARRVDLKGKQTGWSILGPVLPMTGWGSPYVWIWRKR